MYGVCVIKTILIYNNIIVVCVLYKNYRYLVIFNDKSTYSSDQNEWNNYVLVECLTDWHLFSLPKHVSTECRVQLSTKTQVVVVNSFHPDLVPFVYLNYDGLCTLVSVDTGSMGKYSGHDNAILHHLRVQHEISMVTACHMVKDRAREEVDTG